MRKYLNQNLAKSVNEGGDQQSFVEKFATLDSQNSPVPSLALQKLNNKIAKKASANRSSVTGGHVYGSVLKVKKLKKNTS
jgi:hypothetical protein